MTKLVWDQAADRRYEAGVDRGVFYPSSGPGVVWRGLTSVQESPSDTDERVRHIDGIRTRSRRRPGDFSGTIEAFTYPKELEDYLGIFPGGISGKRVRPFGLTYRNKTESGYHIHIVYNVSITPSEHTFDQEGVDPFSWNFTTRPVSIPDARPTSHLIIDATESYSPSLVSIEDLLYGSESLSPQLPTPSEIFDLFEANAVLRVTNHGDGTFTVTGPDEAIQMLNPTTFEITWPSAVFVDEDSYIIRSL